MQKSQHLNSHNTTQGSVTEVIATTAKRQQPLARATSKPTPKCTQRWVPKAITFIPQVMTHSTTIPKATQQATSLQQQESMSLKAQDKPLLTNEPNVLPTVAVVKQISTKGKDPMKVSNPPST